MSVVACTNTPPVHGVIQFDPAQFVIDYPMFTGIDAGVLGRNFTRATLQLNNSCQSLVKDGNVRELLLELLVAHITELNQGTNDGAGNVNPPSGIVGRIASASEGSVSLGNAEYAAPPNANQAYYIQTTYGAEYWQATAKYRTMRYISPQNGGPIGPILTGF
jgi:hypothetical protein